MVLSNTFSNPLKNHGNITEYKQVNKAVHHLIKVWNLRSSVMINVVKVLEDHNIKVVKINSKSNFVVFHTFINESFPILVYNINKAKNLNILFLPELARLLLKFGDINEIQKERLCFHFASEFLSQVVTNNHQKAEEYNRFDQLLNKALFEDYITMSKAASLKNQSLVEFKKNIC